MRGTINFMGFWSNNSFVPTWTDFITNYLWSSPPKLLETLKTVHSANLSAGLLLRAATVEDFPAILEFWGRFFSNWGSCRCVIPLEHLRKMSSWEILVVVRGDGILLGTIVRRHLKNLHVREAKWADAAVIDYYCVHPAWRKKGIGRALLNAIHNTGPTPMPPQLIFWEGLRAIPPLALGLFWNRRGVLGSGVPVLGEECQRAWNDCVKGCDVWTEKPGEEISFWRAGGGICIVWNTFHRTVPDGGAIGIVLGGNADALAASSPWAVLLLPGGFSSPGPSWKMDSPFQWIGYNLSIGFVGGFPKIGF